MCDQLDDVVGSEHELAHAASLHRPDHVTYLPVTTHEDDVDRIPHSEGMYLDGRLDNQRLTLGEWRRTDQPPGALGQGPGPPEVVSDYPAGRLDDNAFGHSRNIVLHQGDVSRRSTGGREHLVQKWEYASVPLISHALQEILNQWGEEGWELVQIMESQQLGMVAYFKRPSQSDGT
jgi:hypothetical protein